MSDILARVEAQRDGLKAALQRIKALPAGSEALSREIATQALRKDLTTPAAPVTEDAPI